MKRINAALLLLTFWLGACAPSSAPAKSTDAQTAASSEAAPPETSDPAPAQREALIAEHEGDVSMRISADGDFIPADAGALLQQGGALQTGANGRARLDLLPEQTIVRVAPNSAFTLSAIETNNDQPKTTLELFFGKVFVLLKGGSLEVQTPSGVASVRGSVLSVSFDPSTGRIQAVCLEGECALANETGEELDIPEGETGYIDENGELVNIDGIDADEIQDWLDEAPELNEFFDELPDPQQYPDLPDVETYDFDPSPLLDPANENGDGSLFNFDENDPPGDSDSGGDSDP